MPPKRSAIGRSTNQAKRRREYRASETSVQREARQERVRVRTALARSLETIEESQARQERVRVRTALARSLETSEESQARQGRVRVRTALARSLETSEERQARQGRVRVRTALARSLETSEESQARQGRDRVRTALARSLETSEESQARQERDLVHTALARSLETSEESQARQERDRADKRPIGQHRRQFNAPTIDEVAIVIVGEEFNSRDIILHRRNGGVQKVSETHRSYDALQYPILVWQGEDGYHFNINMRNPTTNVDINKKIPPSRIDEIISAEIPDIEIDKDLHDIVSKNMIHGPCGSLNNNSPCMSDGKCTKRYPRDLLSETITGNDGYPLYRRRSTEDGGKSFKLKVLNNTIDVDNRWVVLYSPLLLKTIVDIARRQRHHCDDGDRLKFAAPPLLTLGHRVSHSMMQQKHSLWGLRRQQPLNHSRYVHYFPTCFPANPKDLWEKYKDYMSEDILHRMRRINANPNIQFTSNIYNEALILIEDGCLTIANKSLTELGMIAPNRSGIDIFDRDIQRETHFDVNELQAFVRINLPKLILEQRTAYDTIINAISNKSCGLYFLDAPGGTGKTFLISIILATIRSQNNIALAIASSGIAATLLDGGRTAHSALKLPLNMQVIETPTYLRGNEQLFGGALILLAGDFRQTLPVIPRSTPADELNACLKSSVLWRYVKKISLKTNMRVQLQQDESSERFAKQLLDIGNGKMEMDESTHCITLPDNFCHFVKSTDELIAKVFPNLSQNYKNNHWVSERAILSAKNIDMNLINCTIQNKIPEEETTYKSIDTVVNPDESVNYPIEFLNSLDLPGMPPYILSLKIGSPIILLRNINPPRLCNGTRLSVKKLMNNIIEATILNGKYQGEHVLLPRIPMIPTDTPFEFKRLQFPVRLAFAMTINKAQGQSLQ
ncbi:hypothetical protein LAZ67_1006674, partial [Cordylochernes scorpioides]